MTKRTSIYLAGLAAAAIGAIAMLVAMDPGDVERLPTADPSTQPAAGRAGVDSSGTAGAIEPGGTASTPSTPSDVRGLERTAPAAAAPPTAPAAPPAAAASAPRGIHAELLGMPADVREEFLRRAVRDDSFPCDAVNTASALPNLELWRVSCVGAHYYIVSVDEQQKLHAEPISWDAPTPAIMPKLELDPSEGRTLELRREPAPDDE